jgi:hypothetical protein
LKCLIFGIQFQALKKIIHLPFNYSIWQGFLQQPQQIQAAQGQMGFNQGIMNPTVDYSFATGGDDMGNDFNAAFGGNTTYNGHDSLDQSFKGIQPNGGGGGETSDLSRRLEQMQLERNNTNNQGQMQQPQGKFDPMKSPYQTNNQQNPNNNYNDNFFFLTNQQNKSNSQPVIHNNQNNQNNQPIKIEQTKFVDIEKTIKNSTPKILNKMNDKKKKVVIKNKLSSDNTKLLKKYKNVDSDNIDIEIQKLKNKLNKKNKSNIVIDCDSSSNSTLDSDNEMELLKNFISKDNKINDKQIDEVKNNIIEIEDENEESKGKNYEIDEKKKALFKLLIEAKMYLL